MVWQDGSWMFLTADSDRGQTLVQTIMKFWVLEEYKDLLATSATISL